MTAEVIDLDSRRRRVGEAMFCLFCGGRFFLAHPIGTGQKYWAHGEVTPEGETSCDEQASVPEWTLQVGR